MDTFPKIDRKAFFDGMRRRFGRLNQRQVSGAEDLLRVMEADPDLSDIRLAAYMLATAWHETAATLKPICEYGARKYLDRRYDPVLASTSGRRARARRMGNTESGDGFRFRGRGYVQMTWKNNYKRASEELGVDFVGTPENALVPAFAYLLLSRGLLRGWYTGKRLSDYINSRRCDYRNARRTVNGTDKARKIANYATAFEGCLREGAAAAKTTDPEVRSA